MKAESVAKSIAAILIVLVAIGGVVLWKSWVRYECRNVIREEMDGMNLWVVGQWHGESADGIQDQSIQGVFDSEEKAIAACRNENYWIGPTALNEPHPDERTKWPGAYYPKLEPRPEGNDQ